MFCAANRKSNSGWESREGLGFRSSLPQDAVNFLASTTTRIPQAPPRTPHAPDSHFNAAGRRLGQRAGSGIQVPPCQVHLWSVQCTSSCHPPLSIVFSFLRAPCLGTGCGAGCSTLRNAKPQSAHNHPGGNPGANPKSISHRCHLREAAFIWELTKETINLPPGCLQGGTTPRRWARRKTTAPTTDT